MPRKDTLTIGVVARPHGVRGELRVHLYDEDSLALDTCKRVVLSRAGRPDEVRAVARVRRVPEAYLMTLEGVADRDQADALRGVEVAVYRAELPPLAEGEFLIADLVGLRAEDTAGNHLGQLPQIHTTVPQAPAFVLEVGEARLVPLVPELVVEVSDSRVVFDPPEDLPVEKVRR